MLVVNIGDIATLCADLFVYRHDRGSMHLMLFTFVSGAVGVHSNGVTSSPNHNGATQAAASQSVDPQLVSMLQQVANGSVQAETAARHLRELGAGYQQVRDFAQVCSGARAVAYATRCI